MLNGVYMGSQWCEMGSTWGPCGVNWGPVGHIWGSMGSVWIPYGLHVGLNAATRCKRRGGGAVRPTGVWGGGRAKAWNGRRGRARAAGAALWGSPGMRAGVAAVPERRPGGAARTGGVTQRGHGGGRGTDPVCRVRRRGAHFRRPTRKCVFLLKSSEPEVHPFRFMVPSPEV